MGTIEQQQWTFEKLGKGRIEHGKDAHTKELITSYRVLFKPMSEEQVSNMTKEVERRVSENNLNSAMIRIETSKTPSSETIAFTVRSCDIYDTTLAEEMKKGLTAIAVALEKNYFSVQPPLRRESAMGIFP